MRSSLLALTVVWLVLAVAGCGSGDEPARPSALPQGSEPVRLDPADFVSQIDNPYWPMAPGSTWVYRETDGEGNEQRVEVTVTDRTKAHPRHRRHGGSRRRHRERPGEGGHLRLVRAGRVGQRLVPRRGHEGVRGREGRQHEGIVEGRQWTAPSRGSSCPRSPEVGLSYRQEYYAGEAEDAAEVLSLDERVDVPYGSFGGVLMTRDYTPLDPAAAERKYYAQGIGPVLVVGLSSGSGREELIRFESGS